MKTIRIIPRLDIKGPNVVKGIHLEGLRVMGSPRELAKYYYETGADELMFMDVVASLYERNSLHDIISETAKSIFIPLTVGGGLRNLEDINSVLRAGADKVCLNTAAIKNPDIIKQAAQRFGSSTIVISIEAIKESNQKYLAYTDNGREHTGIDVLYWAKKVEELGAGEIVITSVDKEGTGEGYDSDLVRMITDNVSIPVIAHGGAGKKEDVAQVIEKGGADAVALSSILHYDYVAYNVTTAHSTNEGNVEFLKSKRSFNNLSTTTLLDIKNNLISRGISCRI
jgi:cyclase